MASRKTGQMLNPFQHALKRPDTYIGSVKTDKAERYYIDPDDRTVKSKIMYFNNGLFNIVREILSNAIDNVWRSHGTDNPVNKIIFNVFNPYENNNNSYYNLDYGMIVIENDGHTIPVLKKEYKVLDTRTGEEITIEKYPGEVFFGEMFSGTNYDDDEVRKTSGRNGMGAKAANVFSTKFVVDHADSFDNKRFIQTYTENATTRTKPSVRKYSKNKGYTRISLVPDYEYFKFTKYDIEERDNIQDIEIGDYGISKDLYNVFNLYAYEVAMITKVPVIFNGDRIVVKSLEQFAKMFFPKSKMVSIQSPNGDECVIVDKGENDGDKILEHTSFVNGIKTENGGIHTDRWRDTIISPLVRDFNLKYKKLGIKTTGKDLYSYFYFFVRSEVDRPRFSTQTKNELTEVYNKSGKSVPYILYNKNNKKEKEGWSEKLKKVTDKIMKWGITEDLMKRLRYDKEKEDDVKADKRERMITGDKVSNANKCKSKSYKERMKCVLYITEGLSAKTLAISGRGIVQSQRDYIGAMAIKGKLINVMSAERKKVIENEEIKMLKYILNLRKSVDYSKPKNPDDEDPIHTLNYGKISILSDADDDGIHIRGLILLFFYHEYPTLLKRGYVESLSTPVIIGKIGKGRNMKKYKFYSDFEYEQWYKNQNQKVKDELKIDFYKGLGGFEPRSSDTKDLFVNPQILKYDYLPQSEDPESTDDDYMKLAFHKKESQKRKGWITRDMIKLYDNNFDEINVDEDDVKEFFDYQSEGIIDLSTFIDRQLVLFSREDLKRSLPCVFDGLKISNRKILYTCLSHNIDKPVKVIILSGKVIEVSQYHHGDASIQGAITAMGQNYVGSNNISLLYPKGQFGSRISNGNDAASARYISTCIRPITKILFSKYDTPLLKYTIVDNKQAEYETYLPILPILLINGSKGIGTGFSSDVYSYNPLDLVDWIKVWLDDEDKVKDLDRLMPWYMNFKGDVELLYEDSVRDRFGKEVPSHFVTRGILEKTGKQNEWIISEIPIGKSISEVKEWLEHLNTGVLPKNKKKENNRWTTKNKGKIVSLSDRSSDLEPEFIFKTSKNFVPSISEINNMDILEEKKKLRNMTVLDENGYPYTLNSAEEVLLFFCKKRLRFYILRQEYWTKEYKRQYDKEYNKMKFVDLVSSEEINMRLNETEIKDILTKKKFKKMEGDKNEYDYLLNMQMRSMNKNKVLELKKKVQELKKLYETIKNKSPKDWWLEDLDLFEKEYKKYYSDEIQEFKKKK